MKKVSTAGLYTYAGPVEKLLTVLGIIAAIIQGGCNPAAGIIFGMAQNGFGSNNTPDQTLDTMASLCLIDIYLGAVCFVFSALNEICWTCLGDRLGIKVRTLYLKAIMAKSVAWFDENKPQELPTKISSLVTLYQNGIGGKVERYVCQLQWV